MRQLTKTIFAAAGLAGMLAGSAYADDAAPAAPPAPTILDGTLSAYVAVQSDYRFRGITQDSKEATPQGSINWSGPMGFYVGTWESKINWSGPSSLGAAANDPSFEADFFGGKHTDLDGTDLNIEAYYYSYPDARTFGGPKASYYETIVQLTHVFGPLTIMASGSESPQWSLGGGEGWWAEGTATYAVADWLSISGNVGHQWVHAAPSDYTHYDFGATATWHNLTLDARYVGNDIGKVNCGFWISTPNGCAGGFVATVTYNILNLLQ